MKSFPSERTGIYLLRLCGKRAALTRLCYERRGSLGPTTFGRIRMCLAGNSRAKTDRVRVSNERPAKGIH